MCSWWTELKQWKRIQHMFKGQKKRLCSLKDKVNPHKVISLKFGKKDEKKYEETELHKAAQSGDYNSLKQLISSGGNVNKQTGSNQGYTPPLIYAASNGHFDCVKTLLVNGANVNGSDEWNNTALLKAACYQHTDCVEILLEYGADVHQANKWGALPLQYAALQGYNDIVQLLLKYGAKTSVYKTDTALPPPVIGAATRCHLSSLSTLLQCASVTSHIDSSLTMALYYFLCACAGFEYATSQASVTDRYTCIRLLINYGARVKPEHIKMCCYHHFVPLLNLDHYSKLLQLFLGSVSYNGRCPTWRDAMSVIFAHVTRLGPYKWQLIQLICSVGYTPPYSLLNTLQFTLTDTEYKKLNSLHCQPRKLSDLTRQVIRYTAISNVSVLSQQLGLPSTIQDIITCENTKYSAL